MRKVGSTIYQQIKEKKVTIEEKGQQFVHSYMHLISATAFEAIANKGLKIDNNNIEDEKKILKNEVAKIKCLKYRSVKKHYLVKII